MRRPLLLSCTLALFVALPASANPIRLTLALEPAQTLPGIPVTFRVTAVNTGMSPARLPTWVRMELTSGNEPSFLYPRIRGDEMMVELPGYGDRAWTELDPGETRRFDYTAGPASPPWFCDERLQRPGTYRFRMRADRELSGGEVVDSADPIFSNEVELTVVAPAGVDAEAWAVIAGEDDNVCLGWDAEHAEILWSRYPDSVYTPLSSRPTPPGDRAAEMASLQAALARNPPAGFADAIKHSIANRHIMFMLQGVHDGDVRRAFEHSEAARVLFEELAAKDTKASLKAAAQQSLRNDVMTLAELQDYEARIRMVVPPRPQCELAYVALTRAEIAQAASDAATSLKARAKLEAVLRSLDAYEAETAKTPRNMSRALQQLSGAAAEIDRADRAHISADLSTRWQSGLANAAALSAKKAVEAAAADGAARSKMVEQARNSLAGGEAAKQKSDWRTAIRLYEAALEKAENASKARGAFC